MGYFISSFDGGGVRGVLSAELIDRLGDKLVERTDLFAGTSTGAFIALGLAGGLKAQDLVDLYEKAGSKLFTPAKKPLECVLGLEAKYTNAALKEELEKVFTKAGLDPKGPLKQLKKEVVVVAFQLRDSKTGQWEPALFTRKSEISLIDAALASSAAPSYFPSYKGYVDGGVAANSPSVAALGVAVENGQRLEEISLLSVGTGYVEHDLGKKEAWGPIKWIINLFGSKAASSHPLVSLFCDAEEEMSSLNCTHLLGERFFRLNVRLKSAIRLDDTTQIRRLCEIAKSVPIDKVTAWLS